MSTTPTSTSWIGKHRPNTSEEGRITEAIAEIMTTVEAESKDRGTRIYTQAEMVRAIELAMAKATGGAA